MLISMPTGTSTILGVFQAIIGLLAHYGRDSVALVDHEANTEFPNRTKEFQNWWHKIVTLAAGVRRSNSADAGLCFKAPAQRGCSPGPEKAQGLAPDWMTQVCSALAKRSSSA